ncbi:MAG: hypothetical protein ACEQR8_06835 [Cypionkella sp.]
MATGLLEQAIGRRRALGGFLSAFAVVALVREARAGAAPAGGAAQRWVDGQRDIAEGLAAGRITPLGWAQEVERLAAEVDPGELMALVERSQITAAGPASHNDPAKRHVRFLDPAGQPRRLGYGAALFDFAPGNVITPHGHRNMVSAHLVVKGRFRVRNFDRLADEAGAMRIRPTRDYAAGIGQVSTMCEARDNIHWFVPLAGPATTFDVVISGIDPAAPDFTIEAIDPVNARPLGGGSVLAPKIGFADASARYTADI